MKPSPQPIQQFELSPLAKAGVLLKKLSAQPTEAEHVVAAPHRDTHYLLLLATQGRCTLALDFEQVTVEAPALVLVFPGQVHQLLSTQALQGWAVSFDPALLDADFQLVLARGVRVPRALSMHPEFYQSAVALLELLEAQQAAPPDLYTGHTLHALLTALLSRIAGQLLAPASTPKTRESRGVLIEQAFAQLLQLHYQDWKQPARYAAELSITVAHLNDTVKALTGRPVSVHIQQRAILEAKRLLYFTDLSVKEIGYAVGYDEPVYFGKLFRKVAGTTPLQFRQQFRD